MEAADVGSDLRAGKAALRECSWAEARAAFERAADTGSGPEALEGLAQAAFFLDEPGVAIDAHERAYAAYRGAGRSVDAARAAIALAWEYRAYRGEPAVSDGWLGRARRLLEGSGPTPERGWLALREASFALPGDPARARGCAAEAESLGRELGDVDLEMTASALDGLALVSQGEVTAGMGRLDEATTAATSGEMSDPVAIGFSCCYLIFACERVRDLDRAGQWCQRLARMAAQQNVRALRAVCRAHYGTVLMLRGEWTQAEVELTEALAVLAGTPREGADTVARLGELRRRQGRSAEAVRLTGQAEHHPLAILCRAALALERGDHAAAVDGAARYLRSLGGAIIERAPALELLAEAHGGAGQADEAMAAARELRTIADRVGTHPLLGAARHAEGCAHSAARSYDPAREAFEDAVGLLARAGLPYEAGRARVALACSLRSLGRNAAARTEFDQAHAELLKLGAAGEEDRTCRLRAQRRADGSPQLSVREREVLRLVAQGKTNAEIATSLVLSEHTVHRHVANILAKLGAASRAAAVAAATEQDLL
jgi:LuxR family transcriptional regulator, maltose regulon positive regulatory protein